MDDTRESTKSVLDDDDDADAHSYQCKYTNNYIHIRICEAAHLAEPVEYTDSISAEV